MALAVLAAVSGATAACGSASPAATSSPSPVASPSPSPSPAASPSPSGLAFALHGLKTGAAGTILLTKGDGTMTLELQITGLAGDSVHVSHVHVGSCEQPGSIIYALNQVVADGNGTADTKTEVHASYPPASGHWYVVVHAGPDMQGTNATYLLCGNLF
jgi:CHRD domain-containing protein